MPEIVGEYIDRVVNVEMKVMTAYESLRGETHRMYEVARRIFNAPLTYLAAKLLLDRIKPRDHVLMLAGAGLPPYLDKGETDGPQGVASLARALDIIFGVVPVYISEERNLAPIEAASLAAGIAVVGEDLIREGRMHAGISVSFPLGEENARHNAIEILDKFNPSAIIAVERIAPNSKGVFHTRFGKLIPSDTQAFSHLLVEEGKKRGIATIGIGDGGNEIGYGIMQEQVNEIKSIGLKHSCLCPCGSGMATNVEADVLVSSAIANWGAYGVSAALAHMANNRDVMHNPEIERLMNEACATAGAVDGVYARCIPFVDGTGTEIQQAVVVLLQGIVDNALRKTKFTLFPTDWEAETE